MDKEIIFPSNPNFIIGDSTSLSNRDQYTILYRFDSSGCTRCKLHIEMWEGFVSEINRIANKPVTLVFVTNTSDDQKIRLAFGNNNRFSVINTNDETISSLNSLPCQSPVNTFLLNSENRIITIGNPLINDKVKSNYYKLVLTD